MADKIRVELAITFKAEKLLADVTVAAGELKDYSRLSAISVGRLREALDRLPSELLVYLRDEDLGGPAPNTVDVPLARIAFEGKEVYLMGPEPEAEA